MENCQFMFLKIALKKWRPTLSQARSKTSSRPNRVLMESGNPTRQLVGDQLRKGACACTSTTGSVARNTMATHVAQGTRPGGGS